MEIDKYKNDVIRQINKYRKEHGAKPLTNDTKIDKIAQKFAEDLAKKGKLDYSYNQYKGEDLGESVYKSQIYLAPLKLTKSLYDEISDYDFKDKNPEPSNFTQMVWKSSESIGFGMKQSSKGIYFFVLNYYPSGNVDGEFKSNVLPVGSSISKNTTTTTTPTITPTSPLRKNTTSTTQTSTKNEDDFDENSYTKKKNKISYKDNGYEIEYEYEYKTTTTTKPKKEKKEKKEKNFEYVEDEEVEYVIETTKKVERSTHTRVSSSVAVSNKENLHQFCLDALEAHNKLRKIHHVGPLKLNEEICQIAQKYTETLAYDLNRLEHSDNCYNDEPLGENLYFCGGMDTNGETITKSWYNENKIHKYDGDWMSGTGHFTQMIWKDTKEVGFGLARNKKGSTFCVANYYPAGNVMGFFKKNVFRP